MAEIPMAPAADDDAQHPGTPSSAQYHRRIDLQSPADLFYLKNNARRAARSKIDLHLPLEAALREGGTGVDGMRALVESKVNAYIEETYELATRGIVVNGVEGEKVSWEKAVPEEFEPYDYELAARIAAMHGDIEALHVELANIRRETAARAVQDYQSAFEVQSREADEALDKQEQSAAAAGPVGAGDQSGGGELLGQIKLGFEGREADVGRLWDNALETLSRLQESLGETRGEADGAVKVVAHLEGKS